MALSYDYYLLRECHLHRTFLCLEAVPICTLQDESTFFMFTIWFFMSHEVVSRLPCIAYFLRRGSEFFVSVRWTQYIDVP